MLIVYCGKFPKNEISNFRAIGGIYCTPKEMSEMGRSLHPDHGAVFTNSDHVLNGLRLAIKFGEIDYKQVRIVFTNDDGVSHEVKIDKHGNIDKWHDGFFDQIEKDLMQLF